MYGKKMMEFNYKKFHQRISSIDFREIQIFTENEDFSLKSDQRTKAITIFLQTEKIYLERIIELLKDKFWLLEKNNNRSLRKNGIKKERIAQFFYDFPNIYELHMTLNRNLKIEMDSTQQIGKILLEFLSQKELLEVYENYIENYNDILSICKEIETKFEEKGFENLQSIIVSPIQKFPQLHMALKEIYKYTPNDHGDCVNLFKSVSLIKSITARLDRKRRRFEYENFGDMEKILTKLRLRFLSSKLISTHSVHLLKNDAFNSEELLKIPYYLILCNQDIILVPKDKRPEDFSTKSVLCYALNDTYIEQEEISRFVSLSSISNTFENMENFIDNKIRFKDFKKIEKICLTIKGSTIDEELLNKYKEVLYDQDILETAKPCLKRLNNKNEEDKTLLELEYQRKRYEDELNLYFNLMVTFTDKKSRSLCNKQIVLFDSLKILNDWKINFNRAKALSCIQVNEDWLYYSANKSFREMESYELPLVFQPYKLERSQHFELIKYQIVTVAINSVIFRCLWVCYPTGRVIILHFDYKQWNISESFNTAIADPVVDTCTFTMEDSENDQIIDSEIWIASNNQIFIHSLLKNQNSNVVKMFTFPTEIKSLCNVENNIFVALKSTFTIYSKDQYLLWYANEVISLESLQSSNEEIKKIQYGNKLVYIVCESQVILYDYNIKKLYDKKIFDSHNKINVISITPDGVWVSFYDQNGIHFYDCFNSKVFSIYYPLQIHSLPPTGTITCLYTNDKYIWFGTDTGCIACVSTIDSSYCLDTYVPMYFCSKFSNGAITDLLAYENIKSTQFTDSKNDISDVYSSIEESPDVFENDDLNVTTFQYSSFDEVDSVSDRCLKDIYRNWKDCKLSFMLAFGSGIGEINGEYLKNERSSDNLPTIFTFFE